MRTLAYALALTLAFVDWALQEEHAPESLIDALDVATSSWYLGLDSAGVFLDQGLNYRQRQKWDQAVKSFQKALQVFPEDLAIQLHLRRCEHLRTLPLPENWDGAVDWDFSK